VGRGEGRYAPRGTESRSELEQKSPEVPPPLPKKKGVGEGVKWRRRWIEGMR
jgi:hypothetical protein